ncbi:alpha/beta fold hydrolase [Nonomuraea longicatena]
MKIMPLAAAVLLTATTVTTPAQADPVPDLHPCATATKRCDGKLSVPLNWDDPNSERIEVAFAWLPAKKAERTIFAHLGGPTQSLESLPGVEQVLGPLLERSNLLVMDIRGFGKSTILNCDYLKMGDLESIKRCAAELGPRAAHFSSSQTADDLNAIRTALGIDKLHLFGNSYGTFIGQTFAARHPKTVSAMLLDSMGVIGKGGYFYHQHRPRLKNLEVVCDRSRACRDLPSTPVATWTRTLDRLRAKPDPELPVKVFAHVGLQASHSVVAKEVNAAATAYLAGDLAPLRRLGKEVGSPDWKPEEDLPDRTAELAYNCADVEMPFDRSAPVEERKRQFARYHAKERPSQPYERSEYPFVGREEACVYWPQAANRPPAPPELPHPDVPVMSINGEFDFHAPDVVRAAIKRYPRGTFRPVPAAWHAMGFTPEPTGSCVRAAMQKFLSKPTHPAPEARCTAETYKAIGAYPRALRDITPARASGLTGRERTLVAAALATAEDAVARRNPHAHFGHQSLKDSTGLRGGTMTFGKDTIELDRFATWTVSRSRARSASERRPRPI